MTDEGATRLVEAFLPDTPTLHDQFMMAALTGLLSAQPQPLMVYSREYWASEAQRVADACMAERGKQ